MSAFGGKADMTYCSAHVRFMTQSGQTTSADECLLFWGQSGQRIGGMWDLCLWRNDFLKIWVTLDAQKIPLG